MLYIAQGIQRAESKSAQLPRRGRCRSSTIPTPIMHQNHMVLAFLFGRISIAASKITIKMKKVSKIYKCQSSTKIRVLSIIVPSKCNHNFLLSRCYTHTHTLRGIVVKDNATYAEQHTQLLKKNNGNLSIHC